MQNEAKSLSVIATAANNYKRRSMKLKPSLTDSLCYSKLIYVSFNRNKLMPLHLWPPLGGIYKRKWGKAKKCLQPTRNTHIAKDSRVV